MEARSRLYLIRAGLGFVAALLCTLYNVTAGLMYDINDLLTGVSFAILIYLVSYYFLRPHFENKIKKASKILTTGIGIYFFIWIVFWNLFTTLSLKLPVAEFTYSPQNPVVGTPILFNASLSYDPDGKISSYEWYFGDENITKVSEPLVFHTYSMEGNYTVILVVIDNTGGTARKVSIVTVTSAQP